MCSVLKCMPSTHMLVLAAAQCKQILQQDVGKGFRAMHEQATDQLNGQFTWRDDVHSLYRLL